MHDTADSACGESADPHPNPPPFRGISDTTLRAMSGGKALVYRGFTQWPSPFPPRFDRERIAKLPQNLGENEGTLFTGRSAKGWIMTHAPPGPRSGRPWLVLIPQPQE